MDRIKYGQIGVAHAHAEKLAVYRRSDDYEVVGVVEPDAELRRKAESQAAFRDVKWMSEEQLFNVPGLKVVGVETKVAELLDTAERCIARGVHVHLDKPAGESLPQFKRLLDVAAGRHLVVQMGYMFRYNPAVVMLRDFLRRGWLGEPFAVEAVIGKVVNAAGRQRMGAYRGGMMFELGCHVIDLVQLVLGPPASVNHFSQHLAASPDGLLDNMLAVLTYPKALATVSSSALEVEGFARRHLAVCGSEGTMHIQPLDSPTAARVAFTKPRGKYVRGYQELTFGAWPRYLADAADLARVVRGQKDADFSYAHDFQVQQTVLAASGMATS